MIHILIYLPLYFTPSFVGSTYVNIQFCNLNIKHVHVGLYINTVYSCMRISVKFLVSSYFSSVRSQPIFSTPQISEPLFEQSEIPSVWIGKIYQYILVLNAVNTTFMLKASIFRQSDDPNLYAIAVIHFERLSISILLIDQHKVHCIQYIVI